MSSKIFHAALNGMIMRVAHLGVKAFEGKGSPEDLDGAIVDLGRDLGILDDEVVEGAMRRLGIDLEDLDVPDRPWSQTHSHWDDHPDHPHEDWLYEVQNNDTRLGYAEWVDSRIEASLDHDNENPEV